MKPVVLIQRSSFGDSVRYTRFDDARKGPSDVIETETVPVGQEVQFLAPADVELFRTNPNALLPKLMETTP